MHNVTAPQSSALQGRFAKQPFWWLVLAAFSTSLLAVGGSLESLWVDELHTSWTLSGSFAEVVPRARAGNQSPLFFWGLFGLLQTLSMTGMPQELILRLPAIVGWGCAATVCVWLAMVELSPQVEARGGSSVPVRSFAGGQRALMWLAPLAWIAFDRIQLFYASEARVYGVEQLVCLLAWLSLGLLWKYANSATDAGRCDGIQKPCQQPAGLQPLQRRCLIAWCGLSCLLVNIHLTAALAVLCQLGFGTLILYRRSAGLVWGWCLAVFLVLCATGFALLESASVWQQRYQWQSFAGDATLDGLLRLFPLTAFAVPLLLACGVDWLWNRQTSDRVGMTSADRRWPNRNWMVLWLVATFGPWLFAWVVTVCGIAPIFHRRYVIVSALPLVLLATTIWMHIRLSWLRWLTAVGIVAWLVVSQGTFTNWSNGQLIGWQRVEDWRGATRFLQGEYRSGDEIWCASGLIEGRTVTLPLSPASNAYLSFPLRGVYRIQDLQRGQPVEPRALVNDVRLWPSQFADARHASNEQVDRTLWIVFRGQLATLESQLRAVQSKLENRPWQWVVDEKRGFGLVSVARVRLHRNRP